MSTESFTAVEPAPNEAQEQEKPEQAPASPETIEDVREWFGSAIDSAGGDAMKSVETDVTRATAEARSPEALRNIQEVGDDSRARIGVAEQDIANAGEQILNPDELESEQFSPQARLEQKYQERIGNPEARELLDSHSTEWRTQADRLVEIMGQVQPGGLTPDLAEQMHRELEQAAGSLLFGPDNPRQASRFLTPGELEARVEEQVRRMRELNPGAEGDEELRRKARADLIPSQDASLFAIGLRKDDADRYLSAQETYAKLLAAQDMKWPGYERPLTSEDFLAARHRAYYEARRTGRNLFTHVTSGERALQIIEGGALKSSGKTAVEGATERDLVASGQTGNIEENIYFTSGGGGYNYGTKIAKGQIVDRTPEDFAFFATTGARLAGAGKSIEVARPDMSERGESLRGQAVGEYESADGTEVPLDSMVLVVPKAQEKRYHDAMLASGHTKAFAYQHVIPIPDDIVEKAMEHGRIKRDDPNIQAWVDTTLTRKAALRVNKANKAIYATTASRESRDPVSRANGKVSRWMRMSA